MKRIPSIVILLGAVALAAAAPALAQVDISKPIPIKTLKNKHEVFKGEVLNATVVAITVRSQQDEKLIRTFTYSSQVSARMLKIIDQGGYQFGDKVVIVTDPGSSVALQIKGKPSKPI